jgi:hypothetical protein
MLMLIPSCIRTLGPFWRNMLGSRLKSILYSVFQEERSGFWEVIVSVILSKYIFMYMCPFPNSFRDRAVSLYSSLDLALDIVCSSRKWIGVKRQFDRCDCWWWHRKSVVKNAAHRHKCRIYWYVLCCPHTSCKVRWCWRWNFRKCITLGKLYQFWNRTVKL